MLSIQSYSSNIITSATDSLLQSHFVTVAKRSIPRSQAWFILALVVTTLAIWLLRKNSLAQKDLTRLREDLDLTSNKLKKCQKELKETQDANRKLSMEKETATDMLITNTTHYEALLREKATSLDTDKRISNEKITALQNQLAKQQEQGNNNLRLLQNKYDQLRNDYTNVTNLAKRERDIINIQISEAGELKNEITRLKQENAALSQKVDESNKPTD